MPLTQPEPFEDALETLRKRLPVGSKRRTADWQRQSIAIRERSFFSSQVESVRLLQRMRNFLTDYLERTTEQTEGGIALKADGRARFIKEMMRQAIYEGLGPVGIPPEAVNHESLTDIRSEARLKLIFDTQTKMAVGYGYWQQGQDPVILDRYPAARFVRVGHAKEKRPRHAAAEGEVRLKNDERYWANWQNSFEIGGFEVPWPPYGFNSRMDQEDVSRREAVELGLISEDAQPSPVVRDFNKGLKASLRGLDPDMRAKLEQVLGARARGDEIRPAPSQPELPGLN